MTAREYQVRARLAREAFPLFRQGEEVVFCGEPGVLGPVSRRRENLVVVTVKGGQWLHVASPDGSVHGGYGPSFFRLADPDSCGALHRGQYAGTHVPCEFECPRCRRPTPEALSRYWMSPARAELLRRVDEEER